MAHSTTHSEREGTQKQTQASERTQLAQRQRERENAARRANRSFCDPRRKKVNAKFAAGLHYLVSAQLFTRGRESKFQTRQAKVAGFLPFLFPTFDNNMLRVYECNVCVRALSLFRPPSSASILFPLVGLPLSWKSPWHFCEYSTKFFEPLSWVLCSLLCECVARHLTKKVGFPGNFLPLRLTSQKGCWLPGTKETCESANHNPPTLLINALNSLCWSFLVHSQRFTIYTCSKFWGKFPHLFNMRWKHICARGVLLRVN